MLFAETIAQMCDSVLYFFFLVTPSLRSILFFSVCNEFGKNNFTILVVGAVTLV